MRPKKAYISWEDNEVSLSYDLDNKEQANFSWMDSHHSDNKDKEFSDFESIKKHSYDELQNKFLELHTEYLNLYRTCTKQNKIISSLKSKANTM